jgi:hypothetical protein
MKKFEDIKTEDIEITSINMEHGYLAIHWNIKGFGFGLVEFCFRDGKLAADTETLCSNEDKEFIEKLMTRFIQKAEVVG